MYPTTLNIIYFTFYSAIDITSKAHNIVIFVLLYESVNQLNGFIVGSTDDFILLSEMLNFEVGETLKCQQITLINDQIPENTERFTVSLSRTSDLDPRIRISPQEAEIVVTDSDCEWDIVNYSHFHIYMIHLIAT